MNAESVVYIVDDDPSVRKSLSWLLESANYRTRAFESAKDFLASYDGSCPGCLLLDVRMPESSGLQLQSMLDAQQIDVPIIFISGHVDVRTASEAFRAGACDVLTKPVDTEVLVERVEEALEKGRQQWLTKRDEELKSEQLRKLTPKEGEVFQELLKGRTIKQLAAFFDISFQTAAKHRARVFDKLSVDTDAQLIHRYQNFNVADL